MSWKKWLPQHGPMEQWAQLAKGERSHLSIGSGLVETPKRPESLLEMYGALPHLRQDVQRRPDHYTPRQLEIVDSLVSGKALARPATPAEKNELVLTMHRRTEADTARKQKVQDLTAPVIPKPAEEIVII